VLFYRGSWCPYCNAQLSAFQRSLDRLSDLDVSVVALSVDDEATPQNLINWHGLRFPVGHSADARAIAAATGAFVNDDPLYLQATGFVLDPGGRVIVSVYSSGPIERLVPQDVICLIGYLREHADLWIRQSIFLRYQAGERRRRLHALQQARSEDDVRGPGNSVNPYRVTRLRAELGHRGWRDLSCTSPAAGRQRVMPSMAKCPKRVIADGQYVVIAAPISTLNNEKYPFSCALTATRTRDLLLSGSPLIRDVEVQAAAHCP
jgi:peroxiredoxin